MEDWKVARIEEVGSAGLTATGPCPSRDVGGRQGWSSGSGHLQSLTFGSVWHVLTYSRANLAHQLQTSR